MTCNKLNVKKNEYQDKKLVMEVVSRFHMEVYCKGATETLFYIYMHFLITPRRKRLDVNYSSCTSRFFS